MCTHGSVLSWSSESQATDIHTGQTGIHTGPDRHTRGKVATHGTRCRPTHGARQTYTQDRRADGQAGRQTDGQPQQGRGRRRRCAALDPDSGWPVAVSARRTATDHPHGKLTAASSEMPGTQTTRSVNRVETPTVGCQGAGTGMFFNAYRAA